MNDEERFNSLKDLIGGKDIFSFIETLAQLDNKNYKDSKGYTLLHLSVISMNFATLVESLAAGTDPNQQDNSGVTPLILAIWKGSVHLAAALLRAGADHTC